MEREAARTGTCRRSRSGDVVTSGSGPLGARAEGFWGSLGDEMATLTESICKGGQIAHILVFSENLSFKLLGRREGEEVLPASGSGVTDPCAAGCLS